MASEEENQQAGSESQSQQADGSATDARTGTENPTGSEGGNVLNKQEDAGKQIEELSNKLNELTESNKSLQSHFTEVSQQSARQAELLAALDPYIDYDRLRRGTGGREGESGEEEGDETYLTGKQVEKMITDVKKGVSEQILAMNLRQKYPEIFDGGPNEILGRWFLQNKTIPTDSVEKRIEQAVKLTKDHLKSLEDKGRKSEKEETAKAEAEAKEKQTAAAQQSGLSPSGATETTPKPQEKDENKPVTPNDYVAERQKTRLQRQNL